MRIPKAAKNEKFTVHQGNLLTAPELRNLKILYFWMAFLIWTDYLMPQYFGIHIGYDITCTRLSCMVLVAYMILNPKILTHFFQTILRCKAMIPLVFYLFVCLYTMVFRTDLNAFFQVFFEVLTFWLLIYGIRYVIGYKRAFKCTIVCSYFLGVYGLVEFVYGRSLYLQFLRTMYTPVVNAYRSGQYRIMGPCGHPLGYGLLLILLIAMASLDLEKDEVYLFKRPVLMVLLVINVFLTGSRSTLGIAVVEMFVIILFSKRENVKKSLLLIVGMVAALAIFVLLFYNTSIGQYIMRQIASVVDQILGTEYAGLYGADTTTLENSEGYRKYLIRIFGLDWLNPLVGRGVSASFGAEFDGVYIKSIDNFYVQQYIKYAYPGMISYIIFIFMTLGNMIRMAVKHKSAICKLTFIGCAWYFINLWWVDALQTQKYLYIIVAIFHAFCLAKQDEEKMIRTEKFR